MFPNVGPLELIVILVIALIVLGPKKLPEVGRSIGKGMREFKESLVGRAHEADDETAGPQDRRPSREAPTGRRSSAAMRIARRCSTQIVAHARATPRTSAAA